MSYYRHQQQQNTMVGSLQLKDYNHWDNIGVEHWTNCGLSVRTSYSWRDRRRLRKWAVCDAMVKLQKELVNSARCTGNKMVLSKILSQCRWSNKEGRRYVYYRCPFHNDILPHWEQFAEQLESYSGGIERFVINKVMLPTGGLGVDPNPTFFSIKIVPVLNANITTITTLELEDCNLKPMDVGALSTFVKKNKLLEVLNLSHNELFDTDCGDRNHAAKLLAKAMKNHPELSFVNLSSTGIGSHQPDNNITNEALKILLDGSKGIKNLMIGDNKFDCEGLGIIKSFLQKKNSLSLLSMESVGIGGRVGFGMNDTTKAKVLKECLENKNTTVEQLCLRSNDLGNYNDRVLSKVLSGIKGSESLLYVDLSSNDIRRMPSIKLVAKFLARNPSLIELNLNNNGIPTKSADVLIQSLKKNTNLEHLYLRLNSITDKNVPAFTDALHNNTTLRTLDLMGNNLRVQTGRKGMIKALCDMSSLDSVMNSNHTCSVIVSGNNYGGTFEVELNKINALENEGEKIRYKVNLAKTQNKDFVDSHTFDDVPLELMPKLLEMVQQEIGCKGYGEGIVKSVKKRNKINRLSNIYEAIHQWPAFPSLFDRGPGKLKKKRKKKVADEDEDFVPSGFRKTKKPRRWRWNPEKQRYCKPSPEPVKPSRSSSRAKNIASISYADAENSEDES